MIVRVVTARVKAERAPALSAMLRRQLPILRAQPGLVYVKLARYAGPVDHDVILFEEWRDAAALYAWAGPVLAKPRLLPGTEELVDEVTVAHYEALDIELDEGGPVK